MRVKDLAANPENPRVVTEERMKSFKKSLDEYGPLFGVVFNKKNNQLVTAHQTVKTIDADTNIIIEKTFKKPTRQGTISYGYILTKEDERVPYREVQWNDKKQRGATVAANNHVGKWNQSILSDWMSGLAEEKFDLDLTMFDTKELKEFKLTTVDEHLRKGSTGVDEDAIPEKVKPRTKLGDIYRLGEHRLMCGDSTDLATVEKLMNGEKADMVFTDPPYGMNLDASYSNMAQNSSKYKTKRKPYEQVIGDDKQFDAGRLLLMFDYCQEIFLWGADYYCWTLPGNGSWVVWDKREDSLKGINTYGMFGSSFELCWSLNKHSRDIARIIMSGGYMNAHDKMDKRVHPTQKPVSLAEWFFERWGKNKNLIVDLFLGSGSTLIACEKTNRKCYGMELDPHYCDVIVKRWEDYTGKKAFLESKTIIRKAVKKPVAKSKEANA